MAAFCCRVYLGNRGRAQTDNGRQGEYKVFVSLRRGLLLIVACLTSWLVVPRAMAQVTVTTHGNVATATVALPGNNTTYTATVTITFDSALNLTPQSLNLTAQVVNPSDPALTARLPSGVTISPGFPVLITVEPPNFGSPNNDLSFFNTYEFEVHTGDLAYTSDSPYRLFKAPIQPVAGPFIDITYDVLPGSVRARGRGGAFSQFLVVVDNRPLSAVAGVKIAALQKRILAANLSSGLQAQLLGYVTGIQSALNATPPDYTLAITDLDQLIDVIEANAGTNIANEWSATREPVNDAGEMESLAQTLNFTLVRLQGGE